MGTVESIIASDEPTAVLPAGDAQHDPLRLRFCPQCDYAFETLPAVGRCPECGREYDQTFVILKGAPAAPDSTAFFAGRISIRSIIFAFLPFIYIFMQACFDPHGSGVILVLMILAIIGSGFLAWFNSPRPGEVLVWMSAEGVGQQNDFDPGSLTAKLQRVAVVFPWVVVFALSHPSMRQALWWIAISVFVVGCIMATQFFARRRTLARKADGIQPALYHWRAVKPHITRIGQEKCRVRIELIDSMFQTFPVDVWLDAPDELIEHLGSQMKIWQTEKERLRAVTGSVGDGTK